MAAGFHPGELAVQRRAGVAGQAAPLASVLDEAEIPAVAAEFLEAQPIVLVGHQDAAGDVWASVLHGEPGFARARDARTVVLDAAPAPGDALDTSLGSVGLPVGLLAIEPDRRRRMRINGTASREARGPLLVTTESVYANCPKYISTRTPERVTGSRGDGPAVHGAALDAVKRTLVAGADTFFVASAHRRAGADVSHRGGRPGFVRVDGAGTRLSWPDYRGNAMFNTLGNLELDPRAGLLFVDWATGDVLQVRGRAHVDWSPERAAAFPRAERVVDLDVEEVVALPGALGGPWRFGQLSKISPPAPAAA